MITPLQATCAILGRGVGSFLVELHCQETVNRTRLSAPADAAVLDCTHLITADLVLDAAVRPVCERPRGLSAASLKPRRTLCTAVFWLTLPALTDLASCASLWATATLVPYSSTLLRLKTRNPPHIGVIGWEFAALRGGHGTNGDAAQYLPSLHALLLSLPQESRTRENVVALAEAVGGVYSAGAGYADGWRFGRIQQRQLS